MVGKFRRGRVELTRTHTPLRRPLGGGHVVHGAVAPLRRRRPEGLRETEVGGRGPTRRTEVNKYSIGRGGGNIRGKPIEVMVVGGGGGCGEGGGGCGGLEGGLMVENTIGHIQIDTMVSLSRQIKHALK